ncbi:ASCH domain-containing protein [Demetria terragena]|uniref:ASCH domain-containing protein n=1 Tax=Demetria terragena TaxID=63959 RepID=UPI0003656785|nr:ASCH domain-containing protein [Demetria terragena]
MSPSELPDPVAQFWERARIKAKANPAPGYLGVTAADTVPPEAWAFGATSGQADSLLQLVLDGTKTATASALWDYEIADEALPAPGDLSIILDSAGVPYALIKTTKVDTVAFDQVDEEHAYLEGEDDRTLASWREIHQQFFTEHAGHGRPFSEDMPVVLERFSLVYP